MGLVLASSIIDQAAELIQDEGFVNLTHSEALGWLNDGQRAAALLDPTVYTTTGIVALVPGTKQSISGIELLAVHRNMGTDGTTPGEAIRLVDRGVKDDYNPDWHTDPASADIEEYMFDDRDTSLFYVYPQPITPNYIEVTQSVSPPDVQVAALPIVLDDVYAPALIEFIAFRFFSRDAEEAMASKAASHAQMFASLVSRKVEVDAANSPKVREHLE